MPFLGCCLEETSSFSWGWWKVGVHWVAKGVKSQIAHLLKVPRPKERRKPVRRMKTETHFLYHALRVLPLNVGPLSRKRFPGF